MLAILPTAVAAFYAIYGTYLRGQTSVRDGRAQGLIGKAMPDGAPLASVDGTTWIGFLRYHGLDSTSTRTTWPSTDTVGTTDLRIPS